MNLPLRVAAAASDRPPAGPTLGRWLPVLRPHLDEALIGPRALAAVRAVGRGLPAGCLAALELRLQPPPSHAGAPVDLAVRLDRPEQTRALSPAAAPPPLRAFLERWASGEIPRLAVPAVWLEYDLAAGRPPPPPLRCLRLARGLDPAWLTGTLLPLLCDGKPPPDRRRLVLRCLEAVPPGIHPLYLFDLRPRGAGAVRIELYGTEPRGLVAYLRTVAPEAAARRIERLVPLVERCERFHLSIDLGDEVSPRIGLEAAFRRPPGREPRWRELLGDLAAAGLADAERGAALLRWPGCDTLWTAVRRWPGGGPGDGPRPPGHAVRCLSHVKLVSTPEAAEAKGYLLFQHLPAGRGRARPQPPAAAPSSAARRSTRPT